jgi:hypothetical protein
MLAILLAKLLTALLAAEDALWRESVEETVDV